MFIKIQTAFFIFLSTVLVFFSVFHTSRNELYAKADKLTVSLDSQSKQIQDLQKQASVIGQNWQTTKDAVNAAMKHTNNAANSTSRIIANAQQEQAQIAQQTQEINNLVQASQQHTKDTQDALDAVLSTILGKPIGQTFGKRATIKVFSLKGVGYRGYMAKVKIHDPNAVKLVLSHDRVGDVGETTSHAAARTGATLAINGGGFAMQDGLRYPMGITVVDGQIKTWSRVDLSFIGFNDKGELVGGAVTTKKQVRDMHIMQGATFVPTLLEGGKKIPIPAKYAHQKEPRTLIGHFSNGDLLMIVIDGREYGYSSGITLEDAQDKLLKLKIRDAYNLDGGGSSTFYYNGKVLNKPSDGHERLLASNFVIFK